MTDALWKELSMRIRDKEVVLVTGTGISLVH